MYLSADECIELCSEILEEELGKQEEEDVEEEAPLFNDIHPVKTKGDQGISGRVCNWTG